ncbi:protein kinase [Streptosporangium sp. NBC_01755]|uniref:protein kinase domain-containing protein n=1 Tax=unclassified Streptosporangium TaxID=2632669 RepID=UPI002DD93BB1|nr:MULTISPECIES: protein kinase [unclassified Streptosporangium]WSA26135.1 protein kinase [Streptosporangium sp. NBC_01810]WSD02435.1 protein kinase [Streptosporangium sp. NBC_01755]
MPEQQMRVLADRYELIAPLGRGTMGTVWKAHDRSLGREVAIKEIRQEPGLSEAQRTELRERMIREGRTAARISHPSVATVHDAIIEDGSPWIIMELVQARSLEQVIEEEGPLPPRLVAEIGADLLGALRAAHAQGVLHRDVKPGNVLITESGRVVLTDFGIAKAEGDTNLTKTGMVIGSPGYTAPERARGEHNGPESDLWSLGATLYFAVEGRPAYERASVAETLAALMSEQVDPPTQAGPLRPVLEQLLEKDHTARLTTSQAGAMLRAVADTPSHLADSIPPTPAPPFAPSHPTSETPFGQDAAENDSDDFDADRTMVVIRPRDGLRIPGGTTPVAEPTAAPPPAEAPGRQTASPYPDSPPLAEPGRPVAGRQGPPGLGTPVARGPVAAGRGPGVFRRQGNERGFPDSGKPDLSATPPHGFPPVDPEFGAPVAEHPGALGGRPPHSLLPGDRPADAGTPISPQPWRPPGPEASDGAFGRSSGLGTDLFAIAGQNAQPVPGAPGERKAPSRKPPIGILVLMGVAAIALVTIMILVVAAFA